MVARQRSVGKFDVNKSRVRSIYRKCEHMKNHVKVASPETASQALLNHSQLFLSTEILLGRPLDWNAKKNLAVNTWGIMNTVKDI